MYNKPRNLKRPYTITRAFSHWPTTAEAPVQLKASMWNLYRTKCQWEMFFPCQYHSICPILIPSAIINTN
jgi:hypothetical protein